MPTLKAGLELIWLTARACGSRHAGADVERVRPLAIGGRRPPTARVARLCFIPAESSLFAHGGSRRDKLRCGLSFARWAGLSLSPRTPVMSTLSTHCL